MIDKNITPNQVSVSTVFLAIGAAIAYVYGNFIVGGILVQLINIVDGIDGEIARIKHMGSQYGEIIDSLSDRLVEIALCTAIGYGVWQTKGVVWGWAFGLVGVVGFLGGNYLTELTGCRAGKKVLRNSWKDLQKTLKFRLNHRSNQLFIIFILSLLGWPEWALLAIGGISIFSSTLRFHKMVAYLKESPRR